MMTVRVLVPMSGPDGAWSVGDLYHCAQADAERLVASGRVAWVTAPAPMPEHTTPETAMHAGAPERAVRPRGRPRKG